MIASRGMRRGCGAPWSARRTLSSVPKWSFHGRPLPSELVALESSTGRQMFARALNGGTAECYFRLANQFLTQSSPPSCGVTSLAMILNAMNVDPNRRWKGGWRWFDEEVVWSKLATGQMPRSEVGLVGALEAVLAKHA